MAEDKYVLAMYDIRGKQEYIYRSNHMKEIIGGSAVIRDCFEDYLYPAARKYRNKIMNIESMEEAIYSYKKNASEAAVSEKDFVVSRFEERMKGTQYLGEVVYDGGGNFFVLYKDKNTCVEINKLFTKAVMQATYSLKVLCTFVEIKDFSDYQADSSRLYELHRKHEAADAAALPTQVLPFTQVDYSTSMPLYKKQTITRVKANGSRKVSRESYAKYDKYWELEKVQADEFGEKILDKLVTEKGDESLLAIVYIDGNNMGAKVSECLGGKKTYEECVNELRRFSADIQKNYVDDRMKSIDEMLEKKYGNREYAKKRRYVIYAGDEINFICNARDAYNVVKTYLTTLPEGNSACAGIAVFHSHAPYADAYRIAEECCESGKSLMKEKELSDACFVDVHYCQSGIGIELEKIREKEVGDIISKPWAISLPSDVDESEYVTTKTVELLVAELQKLGHSNIKGLAESARRGVVELKMELNRIYAHSEEKPDFYLENTEGMKLTDDKLRKLLYDIVIMYDLWFKKEEASHE